MLKVLKDQKMQKNKIVKNSKRFKANTFGFYSINNNGVVLFKEKSKVDDFISFLKEIRKENSEKSKRKIIIILDNFRPQHAKISLKEANKLNIGLVHLPPYAPDFNPIEFIWKSIKK